MHGVHERYPFAITEALFLSNPGKFATVFANPDNITKPVANAYKYNSKLTKKAWNYKDRTDFHPPEVKNANGDIATTGYTTFINSFI